MMLMDIDCGGGRGKLVNSSKDDGDGLKCVCEPGWTGRSSFVSGEGFDCQVSTRVLRGLWGFVLVETVLLFVIYFPKYCQAVVRFRKRELVKEARNRRPRNSVLANPALLSLMLYFFGTSPLMLAYGSLMIENAEQERVGLTLAATAIWYGLIGLIFIKATIFQPSLLKSLLGRKILSRLHWSMNPDVHAYVTLVFQLLLNSSGVSLYIMNELHGYDLQRGEVTWLVFSGGQAFGCFVHMGVALLLKDMLNKVLSDDVPHVAKEKLKKIRLELNKMQTVFAQQSMIVGIIYLCFASIRRLWYFYDYFFPVIMTTIPLGAILILNTLDIEKENNDNNGVDSLVMDVFPSDTDAEIETSGTIENLYVSAHEVQIQ